MTKKVHFQSTASPSQSGETFPVEYLQKGQPPLKKRARATGLNETGFTLLSEDPLPVKMLLKLTLYLLKTPFPSGSWQAIPLETEITQTDLQKNREGFYRHDLLITRISPEDRTTLQQHLHLASWMRGGIKE